MRNVMAELSHLTVHEIKVLLAYRQAPQNFKDSVDILLDVPKAAQAEKAVG